MHATASPETTHVTASTVTTPTDEKIQSPLLTLLPTQPDFSVVSNANLMVHAFRRGEPDERALISMEPGEYEFNQPEESDAGFSAVRVLSGAVRVQAGKYEWRLSAGESAELPPATGLSFITDQFTQAELSSRRAPRLDDTPRTSVVGDPRDSHAWPMAIVRPPPPPPPRQPSPFNPPPVFILQRPRNPY